MGDAWGVSISCSMDVFNVGKIKRSTYCDALLGGVMVFISPLLDGSCFEMLTLDNNHGVGTIHSPCFVIN